MTTQSDIQTLLASSRTPAQGTLVSTLKEGFIYTVAPAAASDANLITDNGTKLYVSTARPRLDVRQWGVLPENDPAVNDTRLKAMRDQLLAEDDGRLWSIHMPPGHYTYTDNRWTRYIRKLEIVGYGATLQNVIGGNLERVQRWIDESSVWYDGDIDGFDSTIQYTGFPIDTVAAGAMAVTLKAAGDSAEFSVGDRVLLLSNDKQFFAFPPNLRYFQFTRITAIDAGSGTVSLADPTAHEYRDDHPHQTAGEYADIGKARLLNLDRQNRDGYVHPEVRIYRGLTLAMNPNAAADQGFAMTADYCRVEDVKAQSNPGAACFLWPTVADRTEVIRCAPLPGSELRTEPDKTVGSAYFEDCVLNGAVGGTSVTKTTFNRTTVNGVMRFDGGGAVEVNGCLIVADPADAFGLFRASSALAEGTVSFKDTRFAAPQGAALNYLVNTNLAMDAPTIGASATTLDFDFADPATRDLISGAARGRLIWSHDLSDVGTIETVRQSGNIVTVEVDWLVSAAPGGAKTYRMRACDMVIDEGGNWTNRQDVPFADPFAYVLSGPASLTPSGETVRAYEGLTDLVSDPLVRNAPRLVEAVIVDVRRPYTGTDGRADLELRLAAGAQQNAFAAIDLTVAGARTIGVDAVAGAAAGDTVSAIGTAGRLIDTVTLTTFNGSGADFTAADPQALPDVTVRLRYAVPG